MWWQLGTLADVVILLAYLAIALAIFLPLAETGQVRTNRLGVATALIFFSCGVGHGIHGLHALLPAVGLEENVGAAVRTSYEWHQVLWDLSTAAVGVYYWSLRRAYAPLMRGAKLFEDLKEKQRQALEINDNIVQGLTVARMALALDQREKSAAALEATLQSTRQIIDDLLGEVGSETELRPGELVRQRPASVGGT